MKSLVLMWYFKFSKDNECDGLSKILATLVKITNRDICLPGEKQ